MIRRAVTLAAFALLAAAPAAAGEFNVSPTRLSLTEQRHTTLLTLRNVGTEALRFQVTPYHWTQSDTEAVQLTPTSDLVVFPSLLTLAPGESRNVRVGTTASFGETEGTYRIFVEELPPLEPSGERGVRVLTRAGIPVFLAPHRAEAAAKISDVQLTGGTLDVRLENQGNVHFLVQELAATASCAGAEPRQADVHGWYVLPGTARPMSVVLPGGTCAGDGALDLRAVTDQGTWTEHIALRDGQPAR
jgi:fimbrial chaperone protein